MNEHTRQKENLSEIIEGLLHDPKQEWSSLYSVYDHERNMDLALICTKDWVNSQIRITLSASEDTDDCFIDQYAGLFYQYLEHYFTNVPPINKEDIGYTHGHLVGLVRDGLNIKAVIKIPYRNIIRIFNSGLYELLIGNPVCESSPLIQYARAKQIESLQRSVHWGRMQEVESSILATTDVYMPFPTETFEQENKIDRIDMALVNLMFGLRENLIHDYE